MRSLLCLIVSRAHTWRTLRPDFRWVESTFRNTNRLESSRFELIRQNFSPPCAFIRDLTSGKSSSAKRTSGESEVFDPRADSNRLCFKTIRLSLGVLDMSVTSCTQSPTANRRQTMALQTFAVEHFCYRIVKNSSMYGFTPNTKIVPLFEAQLKESNLSGSRGHCP